MPKDVVYKYYGKSYGNVQTCEAQAFIMLVASGMTLFSNVFLNLYYLLSIKCNIKESTLKKYLEPLFLVLSLAVSLILPAMNLKIEYLNPTPYEVFCNVGIYPESCIRKDSTTPCIRGEALSLGMYRFFQNFVLSMISIELLFFIFSMLFIVITSYKSDLELARRLKNLKNEEADELNHLRSRNFTSKIIAQQALMYFAALILSWSFFAITFFKETIAISILKQIFFPLRGMLNMLIFVYHKVYALRRSQSGMSYFQAMKFLVYSTKNIPEDFVSNLEIVVVENKGSMNTSDGKDQQLGLFNLDDSLSDLEQSYFPARIQRRCGMDFALTGDESLCNHIGSVVHDHDTNNGKVSSNGTNSDHQHQDYNSVSMLGSGQSNLSSSHMLDDVQSLEINAQDVLEVTETQTKW